MPVQRPLARVVRIIIAASLLIIGCGSNGEVAETTPTPESGTRLQVLDAGAEPRVVLNVGDPVVGQSWTVTVSYEHRTEAAESTSPDGNSLVALSIDLRETIVEADGGTMLRSELAGVTIDDEMSSFLADLGRDPEQVQRDLERLVGVHQEVPLGQQDAVLEQLAVLGFDSVGTASLPTTAVGEGAMWVGDATATVDDLALEVTRTVTVGSITADTVELTFELSGRLALGAAEASVVGTGSSLLDRRSLQPLRSTLSVETVGDESLRFSQTVESTRHSE